MPQPYTTPDPPAAHVELTDRFALIPEALLYDPTLPAEAVRLYGVLRRHGSDPANCFPSHRRLGELIGKSPRSIPAWLRALEEAGWIDRVARRSASGDPDSNGYRVHARPVERAEQRGVRAEQRGGVRAEQRGGSALESAPKESKGTRAISNESGASAPQPRLDLALSATEQTAQSAAREFRAQADGLLLAWWEARTPKPTQNYPGARKVIERLLVAGWSAEQMRAALPSVPIISAAACELALRRCGGSVSAPIDADRDLGDGEWEPDGSAPGGWRLRERGA